MKTITLNNETVKAYAAEKYPDMVHVTEFQNMPSHYDLGRGSKYATVYLKGGRTALIREHLMVKE